MCCRKEYTAKAAIDSGMAFYGMGDNDKAMDKVRDYLNGKLV